jgi:hypothetical protein
VAAATVVDASLEAAGGYTMAAAEGLISGFQTVAAFTDLGGPEEVDDYTAAIDWGDGQSSVGAIALNSATGAFTVTGSHTFLEEGTYTVTVTITHETAPPIIVMSTAAITASAGILVLDPTGSGTLDITGNGHLVVTGPADVIVDVRLGRDHDHRQGPSRRG